jgi:hypothetical protein
MGAARPDENSIQLNHHLLGYRYRDRVSFGRAFVRDQEFFS